MHVDDLAALVSDVATGAVATTEEAERGPVAGGTTPIVVAGEPATWRDYLGTVTDALGAAPEWAAEHGLAIVHYDSDFEIAAEVLDFEHRWVLP